VDEAQLNRLKTQYRAAGIYAQDNVNGLANAYGRALTSGLTPQDIHEWPDIIQSITAEEILAAARDVFDLNSSVTGWIRK
jgi:zinc protease